MAAVDVRMAYCSPDYQKVIKYIQHLPKHFHGLLNWNQQELERLDDSKLRLEIMYKRIRLKIDYYEILLSVRSHIIKRRH